MNPEPLNVPAWIIIGGWVVTVVVAYVGTAFSTRRAVNKHGNAEMAVSEEIRSELEMMRKTQVAANQLAAELAEVGNRRLTLVEKRIEHLENLVHHF